MPELPEVETTRRGIAPFLVGRKVQALRIRQRALRWPVPAELERHLLGAQLSAVERRAKYLLIHTESGAALLHLGMSGSLRVLPADQPVRAHDHFDIVLDSGLCLRFNDPRRFGCLLWQPKGVVHPLLAELGPEPFDPIFTGEYLYQRAGGRRSAVKHFLMDQRTVVGVGNIYAAEALFQAGIDPRRAAGRIAKDRYRELASAVRAILAYAIERGGTTLRDFLQPDGEPGYFEQELQVYGRAGLPCKVCGSAIRSLRLGQRASCYCPSCQR